MNYQLLTNLWKFKTPNKIAVRCGSCHRLLSLKQCLKGGCKCGHREMREARCLTLRERFKIKFLGFKPALADGDVGKRLDTPRDMGGVQ